jgi:hypothetical protein
VTGVAAGTTIVQATSGNISGSATLTVTAPQVLSYFLSATIPSGGTHPEGVVVADFNGDGKPDLAVSNIDTNTVAVFLNDGTGNFVSPILTTVHIDNGLGSLSVGDFNEDGKADLVVATISGDQFAIVLLGNGDGTFVQQDPIPNSFGFFHARVADLNGDGHQDLLFGENGNLSVSLGKGDGTFSAAVALQGAPFPGSFLGVVVDDFNGDGKLDIVGLDPAFSATFGKLNFFSGNGDGTFADGTYVNLFATAPASLANGDFNGDGKQDLLIGFPNAVIIILGNGDGTFDQTNLQFVYSMDPNVSNSGVTVFAKQLSKENKIDAVTSDYQVGNLQITLNSAIGQLPPYDGIFSFNLAPGISEIAAGDFNGDGIQDIAVINHQTSQVTIVLSKLQ